MDFKINVIFQIQINLIFHNKKKPAIFTRSNCYPSRKGIYLYLNFFLVFLTSPGSKPRINHFVKIKYIQTRAALFFFFNKTAEKKIK